MFLFKLIRSNSYLLNLYRLSSSSSSAANSYCSRSHILSELTPSHVNQTVSLYGWLQYKRLNFIGVIRDYSGSLQFIIPSSLSKCRSLLKQTSLESCIHLNGVIRLRPENQINPQMKSGQLELHLDDFTVINPSLPQLPIDLSQYHHSDEYVRLKYRYLDFRQQIMQHRIRYRSEFVSKIRTYLLKHHFVDIETPTLFRRTPGGAREFIVPTHMNEGGLFYCLTQSPQQFKQLLMIGGFDRYFQIARCYRDETGRPDRQPEFTQVDIEMSFIRREHILLLIEELLSDCWPDKVSYPFPQLTYRQCMDRYGTDKPDTRFKFEIEHDTANKQLSICLPKEYSSLLKEEDFSLMNERFMRVTNENDQICFTITHELNNKDECLSLLGSLRLSLANVLEKKYNVKLRSRRQWSFLWVTDFPLFTYDSQTSSLESTHHPFTAPIDEHLAILDNHPLDIIGQHYDLVLNGYEIGGGSIRIHNSKLQRHILENILHIESDHLEHLLHALEYGAPPHGGIALGLDRILAILLETEHIRDVIPFPKTSMGKDLMANAPSEISKQELDWYYLKMSTPFSIGTIVQDVNKMKLAVTGTNSPWSSPTSFSSSKYRQTATNNLNTDKLFAQKIDTSSLFSKQNSINFTNLEQKLASFESNILKIPSTTTTTTTNYRPKLNNELELDAFLKSERAQYNDNEFNSLVQQTFFKADTDYWEHTFKHSCEERRNLINCLLSDDLRPKTSDHSKTSQYDNRLSDTVVKTNELRPINDSRGFDFSTTWSANRSNIPNDLTHIEQQYANTIIKYNQINSRSSTLPGDDLIQQYKIIAKSYEQQAVSDLWHTTEWMSHVLDYNYRKTDPYLSQKAIVQCSKEYLERSFRQALETMYSDLVQSTTGAVSDDSTMLYSCIIHFIQANDKNSTMLAADDRLVDNVSVWPLIFYSLRSGSIDLARAIISKANLPHLRTLLENYLSNDLQSSSTKLNTTTMSASGKSSDIRNIEYSLVGNPYKRAVICLLDRQNLIDAHEDVLLCVEDFLWIKLSQIPITNESLIYDRTQLSIPRLQRWIIRDLGEDYFRASEYPYRYCRLLILCGAFESAVEYLFKQSLTKVHSIHLALYLHEKYLIGLASSVDDCLLMTTTNTTKDRLTLLNLTKLLELYISNKLINRQRQWEILNYSYILKNIENLDYTNEFIRLLIDNLTNIDDLRTVYGRWTNTLKYETGLLHKLISDSDEVDELIHHIAETYEQQKSTQDRSLIVSCYLYELAKDYKKTLKRLMSIISKIILDKLTTHENTVNTSDGHKEIKPLNNLTQIPIYAYELAQRLQVLKEQQREEENELITSYFLLLDLNSYFDYYLSKQYDQAYLIIRQLDLLPYDTSNHDRIKQRVFIAEDCIQQLIPHVCLSAMHVHMIVLQQQRENSRNYSTLLSSSTRSVTSTTLNDEELERYSVYIRTAPTNLLKIADFARLLPNTFTRLQLKQIENYCEQINQFFNF